MRYPASEKAEIIRLVEASHLPARRTLDKLGIPRATFYRWYDRYLTLAASPAGRIALNPDDPEPPFLRHRNSLKSSDDGQTDSASEQTKSNQLRSQDTS